MLRSFSRIGLFVILWTVALQVTLSMGFPRHEYRNQLSCPPPGGLPASLISLALAGGFFTTRTTWEAQNESRHIFSKTLLKHLIMQVANVLFL